MSYDTKNAPQSPNLLDLLVKGEVRWRAVNPDGSVAWDEALYPNGATTAGLNYLLDTGFRGGTASSNWYVGLINNSGFTALSASDTMSSHSGWSETTGYSNSTRVQWSPGAASGGSVTITTAMAFNINATVSVKGVFVVDNSTKGGTTGTLWATAVEDTARSLSSGQQLQVYYTVTLTPA